MVDHDRADDSKDEAESEVESEAERGAEDDGDRDEPRAERLTDEERQQVEQDEQRLDELGREIDDVRQSAGELAGAERRHFIDEGSQDEGQPVDDTIAPG